MYMIWRNQSTCITRNHTYSVEHNTGLFYCNNTYMYVTCFNLYLRHPQAHQHQNHTKEDNQAAPSYSQYF